MKNQRGCDSEQWRQKLGFVKQCVVIDCAKREKTVTVRSGVLTEIQKVFSSENL